MPLENAVEHVVNCSLQVIGQICMERGVGVHGGRLWSTGYVLLAERVQRVTQFISIEICSICRYYCTCNTGSKVITFAASAIFEIIALKTGGMSSQLARLAI